MKSELEQAKQTNFKAYSNLDDANIRLNDEIEKLRADRAMLVEALEQVKNQATNIKESSENSCCSVYNSSDIITISDDALAKFKESK